MVSLRSLLSRFYLERGVPHSLACSRYLVGVGPLNRAVTVLYWEIRSQTPGFRDSPNLLVITSCSFGSQLPPGNGQFRSLHILTQIREV